MSTEVTMYRHQLGDALRKLRIYRGLRLADVATAAHVSQSYLSEVERGVKEPSSELIKALCDALDVSVSVSLHMRKVQLDR